MKEITENRVSINQLLMSYLYVIYIANDTRFRC